MNSREFQVYRKLTKCQRAVATLLSLRPELRDSGTDEFVMAFKGHFPHEGHGIESIRRSRQIVQNEKGFMPRTKDVQKWNKPVKEASRDGFDNPLQGRLGI